MIASILCIYMAAHSVQSTWTYFTMLRFDWDEATVGWSLALVGLLVGGVQGGLIRVVIPKIGQKNAVYVGITLYTIGLTLFSLANQSWMMFAFLIPYALGGVAGPALQGIMSTQVPGNAQGELQGGLTGLVSLTSIFGPMLMTGLFHTFTDKSAGIYFPGAPFVMGAVLCFLSLVLAMRTLKKHHI